MDLKYNVLCEWVKRDLIKLERVATKLNLADHFAKQLGPLLFHRHVDCIMGRVRPQYSPYSRDMVGLRRRHPDETVADEKKADSLPVATPTMPAVLTDGRPFAAAAAKLVTSWKTATSHYVARLAV